MILGSRGQRSGSQDHKVIKAIASYVLYRVPSLVIYCSAKQLYLLPRVMAELLATLLCH